MANEKAAVVAEESGPPKPVKAGTFGFYDAVAVDVDGKQRPNGKKVPIQKNGVPFSDVKCASCGCDAPFPLEYNGDLVCSHVCGADLHPNHPNLTRDKAVWEHLNKQAKARSLVAEARAAAAEAGVQI
jgi:hypothetical protein